jgi:hypothetical protein
VFYDILLFCTVQELQKRAQDLVEQRRVQCDLELLLEAGLNEADLKRMESLARVEGCDREARYMKLFADFQTQKTHLVRALAEARDLRRELESNEAERARMAAAIKSLEVCVLTSDSKATSGAIRCSSKILLHRYRGFPRGKSVPAICSSQREYQLLYCQLPSNTTTKFRNVTAWLPGTMCTYSALSIDRVFPEQEQKGRLERMEKERNDRDVQELEIRNVANQRLGWLSSYQSVAKVRMEAQQEQLAPLLVAAKQSKAELQEAEELQVCLSLD